MELYEHTRTYDEMENYYKVYSRVKRCKENTVHSKAIVKHVSPRKCQEYVGRPPKHVCPASW